jgi:hypothetical protein
MMLSTLMVMAGISNGMVTWMNYIPEAPSSVAQEVFLEWLAVPPITTADTPTHWKNQINQTAAPHSQASPEVPSQTASDVVHAVIILEDEYQTYPIIRGHMAGK